YTAFYEREIDERRQFSFPPFCRMIKLVFSGPDEKETQEAAALFRSAIVREAPPDTEILPVLPAGHPKIKERYRFQFLMKTKAVLPVAERLESLRQKMPFPKKIQMLIDIDPTAT